MFILKLTPPMSLWGIGWKSIGVNRIEPASYAKFTKR